jgi:cysteinyl-tRNA synthetase
MRESSISAPQKITPEDAEFDQLL